MQVQTVTIPTAKRQPVRHVRRLTDRYAGDEAKARRVKRMLLHFRALFDDARRARLFDDQIVRAAELRDLADQTRLTAQGAGYDALSPIWRLHREAEKAEADLRRLAVPALDSLGADVSGAALLAALGIGPHQRAGEGDDGGSNG